jgi:excisionase family DNA binding protein
MDDHPRFTGKELAAMFADPVWAERFPPILSPNQAAELLQVPKLTIYDWSSRGLLDGCKFRAGKHLRLIRDRLLNTKLSEEDHGRNKRRAQ